MSSFKKIISFFLIITFSIALFPKEYLHELLCNHELHQHKTTTTSFENAQHHCPFFKADFSNFISSEISISKQCFTQKSILNLPLSKEYFLRPYYNYGLRAPPDIFC